MIYDIFNFCKELDLLEIRLNILSNVVDKFVLIESPITFTGKEKPLYYELNQSRFNKFKDKITYIKSPPIHCGYVWGNEWYCRNLGGLAYEFLKEDDIIMLSDADEIPDPVNLSDILSKVDDPVTFNQQYSYYKLNMRCINAPNWPGTVACRARCVNYPTKNIEEWFSKEFGLQKLREGRATYPKVGNGWHYSYCLPEEDIQDKIRSFSHAQDLDKPQFNNLNHISNCISKGESIWVESDGNRMRKIEMDETNTPKYILDNLDKYKHLIL